MKTVHKLQTAQKSTPKHEKDKTLSTTTEVQKYRPGTISKIKVTGERALTSFTSLTSLSASAVVHVRS